METEAIHPYPCEALLVPPPGILQSCGLRREWGSFFTQLAADREHSNQAARLLPRFDWHTELDKLTAQQLVIGDADAVLIPNAANGSAVTRP